MFRKKGQSKAISEEKIQGETYDKEEIDWLKSLDKEEGNQEIHKIAKYGKLADMKKLINDGGDPNILNGEGKSALSIAIKQNRIDILQVLLEAGAKPNTEEERQPFIWASNNVEMLKLLYNAGANPNADDDGYTALESAEFRLTDLHETSAFNSRQSWWKKEQENDYQKTVKELESAISFIKSVTG